MRNATHGGGAGRSPSFSFLEIGRQESTEDI
jgi:hypothetical protein